VESRELRVAGAFEFTPVVHRDARGEFSEAYRFEAIRDAVGVVPEWKQTNLSVSARGVIRGIHYSIANPGQIKYVTVAAGRLVDYVVDLRQGSPTYGAWDQVELNAETRRAVYVPAGVGHAFVALEDGTAVSYLCSEVFDPAVEFGVSPFDPALGIEWALPRGELIVSDRDAGAPTRAEAIAAGQVAAFAPLGASA
jgi:dTDP-4-dehydrorhamnose 3,5-epimerase